MATIAHLFHIDAPLEKVFKLITTIEGFKNWWTQHTSGGERIGEVVHFRFTPGAFIDLKLDENNQVDFVKWTCVDAHPEWIGTQISFQLSEKEGKTEVQFHHSGWESQTPFFANCNFSWGKYLLSLRDYCEKGKGQPFKR